MGIIAIIIGGLIGYLLSRTVIAENWWYKLCYALFTPLLFTILVVLLVMIELCDAYQTGIYCAPFIFGCIAYSIMVFIKMKIEKSEED